MGFVDPLPLLLLALLPFNAYTKSTTSNSTDRAALLYFKSMISDPFGALSSWSSTNQSLHLCQWRGVACGAPGHPDRVTSLTLDTLELSGHLSSSLSNLTFLETISLPNNNFIGPVPPELGRLSRLQVLSLSNNSLTGEIPANLSHCRRLIVIDLDTNSLSGDIPAELGSLSHLSKLNLYTNNLTGSIPDSFRNLSSITTLDLSENRLVGNIPFSLAQLPSLGFFQLSINILSGELSPAMFNSSSVYYLDVGSNAFYGALPSDIGSHLPMARKLYLYSNQLQGSIPKTLGNASRLERLGIEGNQFVGVVPVEIGTIQALSWLALGNNQLVAEQPSDYGFLDALANYSTNLEILEISDNLFGGTLPRSIANLSTQLTWLSMEDNHISGSIPAEMGRRYVNLTFLSMSNNALTGSIPAMFGGLQSLNVLRLRGNRLSGELPSSLGNLTMLNELDFGGNGLEGSIPTNFGSLASLNLMNLSHNKLTGPIPREVVSLSSLTKYVDMSYNSLTGALPSEIGRLRNLVGLNVSNNKLSGEIPSSIGQCQVLAYLQMRGNFLQGIIPRSMSSLKGIQELDLSRNNLSGDIPGFLESLRYLQFLNISFNDLEGQVPTEGVFGNVSQVSLVGNQGLCGGDPELQLQACPIGGSPNSKKHSSTTIIAWVSVVAGLFVLLGLIGIAFWVIKISKKRSLLGASITDDHHSRISYNELFKATDGFSATNLIGTGGFGYVYRGVIGSYDKAVVAVKVLDLQQRGASRSFEAEYGALRSVRHRNLVKIMDLCVSVDSDGNDFKALIFEYMPNGSLDEWLHPEVTENGIRSRNLSFIQRLNIAIDVGFGIDYLHHYCPAPIVHCDLKPSNVLLDDDLVAHVSDFGLAKILATTNQYNSTPLSSILIQGSIGYIPPEYGMGSEISTDGDVYSYGILLLEMLTGRRPTDEAFMDVLSLPKYVEMKLHGSVMDIIDSELLFEEENDTRNERMQECLVLMIGIALSCSKESPRERREMGSVVKDLVATRDIFLSDEMPSKSENIENMVKRSF